MNKSKNWYFVPTTLWGATGVTIGLVLGRFLGLL